MTAAVHAAALTALALLVLHLVGCALSERPFRPPVPARGGPLPHHVTSRALAFASSEKPQSRTRQGHPAVQDKGTSTRCPHPETAWTTADGIDSCARCGTQRVTDYRALGLATELPERGALYGPTVTGVGLIGDAGAQRRDELRAKVREANRRSSRGKP